jgi:hypothetical protein
MKATPLGIRIGSHVTEVIWQFTQLHDEDRTWLVIGRECIDQDRTIIADQMLHQPQPSQGKTNDVDVLPCTYGKLGELFLDILCNSPTNSVITQDGITESDNDGLHDDASASFETDSGSTQINWCNALLFL